MKRAVIILAFLTRTVFAQEVLIDPGHFQAAFDNGVVRSGAEVAHQQYLTGISQDIDNLNINTGAVVLAQNMIYQGLSNVNSALKNGLEVKNMTMVVADMTGYIAQALDLARSDPYLLVFARQISADMKSRALALVNDVSSYVLKSGGNMLADFNARDQLLHKIIQQLQLLDGLAYGAWKAMYWAKERGFIASATPFANYINRDKAYVLQIIQNAKYLKQ
jgi:hypothetical protein